MAPVAPAAWMIQPAQLVGWAETAEMVGMPPPSAPPLQAVELVGLAGLVGLAPHQVLLEVPD